MAIGFRRFPCLYLLPKKKRVFVQVSDDEFLIWGDVHEIAKKLKQIVSEFKCHTGNGCHSCRNAGKWGPCCNLNIMFDGDERNKPPAMQLSLSTCYSGGSRMFGTVLISAPWGSLEDLRHILAKAGVQRITFAQTLSENQLSFFLQNMSHLKALEMGERAMWKGGHPNMSVVKAFIKSLSYNTVLKNLSLHKNDMPDDLMALVLSNINKSSVLEQLDLSGNCSGPKVLTVLGEMLEKSTRNDDNQNCFIIKELDLSSQRSTQIDISPIAAALKNNKNLESLDLSKNNLDEAGLKLFSESLSTNMPLKKIVLQSQPTLRTFLTLNGSKNLFSVFGSWRGVTFLDISYSPVSREMLSVVVCGLRQNTSLQTFRAKHMYPCGDDVRLWYDFAHAIRDNPGLTTLDISGNKLDLDTVTCLAQSLTRNRSLERLGMNSCSITNDGVKALCACLPSIRVLKSLCLSFNDFDEAGSRAILEGLKKGNRSLLSVEMFDPSDLGSAVVGRTCYSVGRYKKDYADVNLFLKTNQYSLHLLNSPISLNLWPLVLSKASKEIFDPYYTSPDWLHEPDYGDEICHWAENLDEYVAGFNQGLVFCLLNRGLLEF